MGQKAITIYTPSSTSPHIYAEDDAQLHRGLIGGSGIMLCDNNLACTAVSANLVRLASGVYSNQGYIIVVEGGTVADLTVQSGTAGAYRHDLVVAHFTRGSGEVADTHVFEIVQGTNAASAAAATDPAITQDDLTQGGTERSEVLYRLNIAGTVIESVERVANYIGNVYQ